ncbi:hypothetical protein AUR64_05605 [Haloprofundus marisrubri]|uniref:Uncharacterized protein n=1 Tax=Haloprofundus marisrubri TaxID=1514971 RepID=A0A0W1RB21_9EURY|nr:hypothetical protein AUR64_05605 [Haloprofundus marisrubri]
MSVPSGTVKRLSEYTLSGKHAEDGGYDFSSLSFRSRCSLTRAHAHDEALGRTSGCENRTTVVSLTPFASLSDSILFDVTSSRLVFVRDARWREHTLTMKCSEERPGARIEPRSFRSLRSLHSLIRFSST